VQSPAAQEIAISKQGDAPLNWRVAASTTSGGNWLAVNPASGTEAGRVAVRAEPGALGPGEYRGSLTVTADGAINSPLQVPVTLTVERAAPVIRLSTNQLRFAAGPDTAQRGTQTLSITNAGFGTLDWRAAATTFNGGAWLNVSPSAGSGAGSLTVTADATGLAGGTFTGRITFTADGATNFENGPRQSWAEPRCGSTARTRRCSTLPGAGVDPGELDLPVAAAAPGVFTLDGRRAAALNQDNQLNTPQNPAPPGSVIQLFVTGLGAGETRVSINALDSPVRYAGPAPGFPGLGQVNVEIPVQIGASDTVRVVLRSGTAEAPPVFIAVRSPSENPRP